MSKLTIALLASIATLSFGAYAGDKDKSTTATGTTATDSSAKKSWTKDEALKGGLTEEQFKSADSNADGNLDDAERQAANIQTKAPK